MEDATTTAEHVDGPAETPADVVTALTSRYSWDDDETFVGRVESARKRRDQKAEAHWQMARTVVDNDLPWPSLDLYVYGQREGVALVARYRVEDIDTFRLVARAVRRAVGGLQAKSNDDGSLTATVVSGPVAWDVTLTPEASPCEQIQIGTETRTVREEISPPRYHEIEKEEPVYEWRCPENILSPADLDLDLDLDDDDEDEDDDQ